MAQWWEEWQLRILVLASLSAQYLLVLSARARKFHLPPWLKASFRLAHLGSDALAIFALVTLFNRQKGGPRCSYAHGSRDLELLWAPILVMHLGGQVAITSYKIEDNEQWRRHILTSLSKVTVALYVFYKSWSSDDKRLLAATILLFILVIIRSFQKALNLKGSSFNALRKASSLPKWVTVCIRRRTYGHGQPKWKRDEFDTKNIASIEVYVQDGRGFVPGFVESQVVVHGLDLEQEEAGIRQCTPQRRVVLSRLPYQLFLDFSCQYINRLKIMRHLWSLDNESAYLTIEGMLSAMTSFLYTKDDRTARLDFKNATPLLILRRWTEILITYATLIAVISLVHTDSHKETYSGTEDTWVTFVLLYGTLVLELVYTGLRSAFQDKFSGKILQHNLIGLVAHNKWHSRLTRIAACLGCKELVDEYFWHMKPNYSSCRDITELVRGHVRSGWLQYIRDASCYRKFNDSRGDWTLAMNACLERLDWSIQMPFDESIILWHLATDLCFHRVAISPDDLECARQCKVMSNYMMHLLFENPEMLMPGSRRNLLSGACDELHQLLQDDKTPRDERGFTLRVMEIFDAESESVIHPGQDEPVNPNLCMTNNNSIVHNAWRLAKILLCLCDDLGDGGGQTRMWKVIQGVWVEMLCFSAGRSRGYLHAEALGTGVEYLSYIWILWAYSGMETFADKLQRREGLIRQ